MHGVCPLIYHGLSQLIIKIVVDSRGAAEVNKRTYQEMKHRKISFYNNKLKIVEQKATLIYHVQSTNQKATFSTVVVKTCVQH
jgi:ABC-type ATPase involved in cell division